LPLAAQTLSVEEWEPRSTLVVEEHPVPRAKFPVIDVHSHHRSSASPERLKQILGEMDQLNLGVLVNLSGGAGSRLHQTVDTFRKGPHGKRFAVFGNLDFSGIDAPDWGQKAAAQLAENVRYGAQGLKFFKNFGMDVKYSDGKRVHVDDPKLDPVFEVCAREKIPVLIHVAEPAEFFLPFDRFNPRWLELKTHPGRKRPPEPSFETLIAERDRLVKRHPNVNFIYAHMGWHGNDLERLGKLFDDNPNLYVDVAAVLYELGRVPFAGRKFMIQYADRILFGKDTYTPSEYPYYWRVFETRDEFFDYYRRYHANWQLYGLDLPDETLKKLYYRNALRLIPGIDPSGFPE
jgi:predicted TIM-barrel fold metal-dependent hydrolase